MNIPGDQNTPRPAANPENTVSDFARVKEELEIEKLRAEIAALQKPVSKIEALEKYLPLVTAVVAVLGFWGGLWQFRVKQQADDEQSRVEMRRANDAYEAEARKPFKEKQLALYFEVSEAASTIATSDDAQERRNAQNKFWMLYQGPLAIVEDAGTVKPEQAIVAQAMVRFGRCLDKSETCSQLELQNRSLDLAQQCRNSMGTTWNVKLSELPRR